MEEVKKMIPLGRLGLASEVRRRSKERGGVRREEEEEDEEADGISGCRDGGFPCHGPSMQLRDGPLLQR